MLGKVVDHGPHTNCTSHSLTFHPPMDLQPSFNSNVQKFLALCRKQAAKLDRLGICQIPSPSVIYELIGLLAHPIKSLTDRTNLKERLGIRFTKIRKRFVISE